MRRTGARRSCPGAYQGTHLHPKGPPIDDLERPPGMTRRAPAGPTGFPEPGQPASPRSIRRRGRARGADPELRAGLPDAVRRARGDRLRSRSPRYQAALRHRRSALRPRRSPVPDGAASGRARRAFRPDLLGGHGQRALVGRPRRHQGEPRTVRRRDRPTRRGPCWRTSTSAACSTRRW